MVNRVPPSYPLDYQKWQSQGYQLRKSLPEHELLELQYDLQATAESDVKELAERINKNETVLDTTTSRKILVTALKALEMNLISVEQMTTLHIIDAAIRDLITHIIVFQIYTFIEQGKEVKNTYTFPIGDPYLIPKTFQKLHFDAEAIPSELAATGFSPKARSAILQQFFHFTDKEWERFCSLMQENSIPSSEKEFYLFYVPKFGCWSGIVQKIQEVLHLFKPVKTWAKLNSGIWNSEDKIPIPSFTMFNVMLKVKAETLGRKPVELFPTYYRLAENEYWKLKSTGLISLGLYFPEVSFLDRYSLKNSKFKGLIDGWGQEGPLGSIFHDVYHALREMAMTENVALARYRLAFIAFLHKNNKMTPESQEVSNFLVDGELIHSHSMEQDSSFALRPLKSQKFGEIFSQIKDILHPELKHAFIKDMVEHADEWRENFNLGIQDLLEEDQFIYKFLKDQKLFYKDIAMRLAGKNN